MKKILLPAICLLLAFSSCKKKNDIVPVNSISATINGLPLSFNANVTAVKGTAQDIAMIHISGAMASDNAAAAIDISVSSVDTSALIPGTYTLTSKNTNPTVYPFLTYSTQVDNPDQSPFNTDVSGVQATTITITSISSTNVQGTFSGTLIRPAVDSATRTITNGRFNVNLTK